MQYYIWVLGCAMNKSDAERIASVLCGAGFSETKKESEADIIITVACSVRQHAIDRIYGKAKNWQRIKKERPLTTVLSGCVLERDKKKMAKIFDFVFEIKEIEKLKQFLDEAPAQLPFSSPDTVGMKNPVILGTERTPESLEKKRDSGQARMTNDGDFFQIHPKYNSTFQAYVPISTGCNNFCTYCAVPYTRGREISRPMDEILSEVKELVKKGYKEITLLGQNVNSYGSASFAPRNGRTEEQRNNGTGQAGEEKQTIAKQGQSLLSHFARTVLVNNAQFVQLLKKIDAIPGNYRVYFYSNHPKDMSDELIATLSKLQHFPRYIHLPLQSGSNKILKAMNRHYTKEKYLELAGRIKKAMPDVALTTDIIVGFPGETDKDFEETKKVMKKVGFSFGFIAKYSPRPGTVASKLKDNVSKIEKERRWRELTDIQEKILEKENKKLVGERLRVLIDSEKKGKYYGRTDSYKVVEISSSVISTDFLEGQAEKSLSPKKQTSPIGQFVEVEITDSTAWMLRGETVIP